MPARANSNSIYHKIKPEDMPEVRRTRSLMMKYLKLMGKSGRTDRISKAILPDIDWCKLGIDPSSNYGYLQEEISDLTTELNNFRTSMAEKLESIMWGMADSFAEQAHAKSTSDDLFEAANDMAEKYVARSEKPRAKRDGTNKTKQTQRVSKPSKTAPAKPFVSTGSLSKPQQKQVTTKPSTVASVKSSVSVGPPSSTRPNSTARGLQTKRKSTVSVRPNVRGHTPTTVPRPASSTESTQDSKRPLTRSRSASASAPTIHRGNIKSAPTIRRGDVKKKSFSSK